MFVKTRYNKEKGVALCYSSRVVVTKNYREFRFKKRAGYGTSVSELFFMVFASCFFSRNKTVYGNFTSTKQSNVCTTKSALYRFLSNEHNNWRKLLLLL